MAIVLNGQVGLTQSRQQLAAAGKYFIVTNPTPGTAVAYANQTSFSATANGLLSISNGNVAGGPSLYLDRLSLTQTATVPTGTLVLRFEVYSETGIVALSAGNLARTPVNVNSAFASTTGATVNTFSAAAGTVPSAVGTRRLLDVVALQTGVTVIHDTFVLDFGGDSVASGTAGLTAARATAAARMVAQTVPLVIPPGNSAWLNMWWVTSATNVPSFEFSLGYCEL